MLNSVQFIVKNWYTILKYTSFGHIFNLSVLGVYQLHMFDWSVLGIRQLHMYDWSVLDVCQLQYLWLVSLGALPDTVFVIGQSWGCVTFVVVMWWLSQLCSTAHSQTQTSSKSNIISHNIWVTGGGLSEMTWSRIAQLGKWFGRAVGVSVAVCCHVQQK